MSAPEDWQWISARPSANATSSAENQTTPRPTIAALPGEPKTYIVHGRCDYDCMGYDVRLFSAPEDKWHVRLSKVCPSMQKAWTIENGRGDHYEIERAMCQRCDTNKRFGNFTTESKKRIHRRACRAIYRKGVFFAGEGVIECLECQATQRPPATAREELYEMSMQDSVEVKMTLYVEARISQGERGHFRAASSLENESPGVFDAVQERLCKKVLDDLKEGMLQTKGKKKGSGKGKQKGSGKGK